ncbi:MAG: hypothetical protein ACTSUE_09860 [Promethearchaeota archaeon]
MLPEEALFVAEENPERDGKKAKPPKRNLMERKLCILLMFYNASYKRIELHHYPIMEHIGMLEQDGIFIQDYNEVVAREIWSMGVNQSHKMQWKASDPKGDDLHTSASYAARRKALPKWIGIKVVGIWDLAKKRLGFTLEDNYSSGYSLENRSEVATDPHPRARVRGSKPTGGTFVRQKYAPKAFNYSIIRDCAIHSATDFSHLFDMVDKTETLGSEESAILTPGDASRISDVGFYERRQVLTETPKVSGDGWKNWKKAKSSVPRDRTFVHSIEIFYKREQAEHYAYKYRLPMFAHDKTSEGTKKIYGVMGSWLEAYRSIRLRAYEIPPSDMYQGQCVPGNYSKRDQPSFHDCMLFSHECYGGPRRIKLFIDMDAKPYDNPQFLDDVNFPEYGMSMERVNRTTRSTIRWFTNFVNRIFGAGTCSVMDWVVTCATNLDRVMSRHACLDKPGCYFNSMMDLMAFMYLAEIEQTKEIGARNPKHDFNDEVEEEEAKDISWMLRRDKYIDSMTKMERFRHTSVVDFSVYNRTKGNIRCVFCPKASDPERVLNPLIDLFPGDNYHILDLRAPVNSDEEFKYFMRNMVTFVERTDKQKHDGWDGWKMPLGAMGGVMHIEDAKVPRKILNMSKYPIGQGEDSMDEHGNKGKGKERINQTVIFLAALPIEAWYATSTIPNGVCMERMKQLISSYRSNANMSSRKRKTRFGAFKYARTVVIETSEPTGTIKTIRDYFVGQTKTLSGHHLTPWVENNKGVSGMRVELCINNDENRNNKARTDEEIECEERVKEWKNKRRFGYGSNSSSSVSSHRAKREEDGPVETPITNENKKDHYQILLRHTKWCPIREKRMGQEDEGYHKTQGSGYMKIFRNGRVCYHCLKDKCGKDMELVFGVNSYYWELPYLNTEQRKNMWAGV